MSYIEIEKKEENVKKITRKKQKTIKRNKRNNVCGKNFPKYFWKKIWSNFTRHMVTKTTS